MKLKHAIGVAEADGPARGLRLLDALAAAGELARSLLLPASRAELRRRLGRNGEALGAYTAAVALTANDAERDDLTRRRQQLRAESS